MKIIYGVVEKNGIRTREHIILENRKCEQCGIEFEPQTQESKYCSRKCSKRGEQVRHRELYRKRSSEYYVKNIEECRKQRREYYWKNPELFRLKAREYREKNYDAVRERDIKYKDKVRHGGKRNDLVQQNGLKCYNCGHEGTSFEIATHHTTFNPTEHDSQELLCRKCHQRVHRLGVDIKPMSREDIINAINKTGTLAAAAKMLSISRQGLRRKRKKFGLF